MKVTSFLIEAHIFRKKGDTLEFLLMKRAGNERYPNIWQMVTGSIAVGEKAYATALREIREESGIEPLNMWVVPFMNSFYSPEKDLVCMVPVFAAEAGESSKVRLSEEHSEFKWLEKEEAKKLMAWQGQRPSVDVIFEYFTQEKSFLEFVRVPLKI